MRRLRIVAIVLGALAALGLAGLGITLFATRGATTAADHFLSTLATQGPQAAYAEASPVFRAGTSEAAFVSGARQLGLTGFTSASWPHREIEGGKATLEGTLTLANGGALPAKVTLTKDGNGWRVESLNVEGGGLSAGKPGETPQPTLPDDATDRQLAQVTLQQLADAIAARNFAGLYASTATAFQQQFSQEKLAAQFKPLSDRGVDLTRADFSKLQFTKPAHFEQEIELVLTGVLPVTQPLWYFEFGYIQEAGQWRLFSVGLSTTPK